MRLNRYLAAAGLGSRRSCEELILAGEVTINGVVCDNLATTVEPNDVVKVGNRVLRTAAPVTLLLNKPPGYICTASDTHNRQTIFDLLPPNYPRLFHVGRLDRESEGLLILTNDGSLALKLTHPRYKVDKEYEVVLDHPFDSELIPKLLHGISLEEGWAKAEEVHKLAANKVKVILRQGMKRQIRLMFYALGYEVKKLVRVRIGTLEIGNMPAGSCRALTQKEIEALLAEGAKTATERPAPASRPVRKPRPAFERQQRPFKPRQARATEEIPFVPRASRSGEAGRGSTEKPARKPFKAFGSKPSGAKAFGAKPFGAKPFGSKPPGSRPFGTKPKGKPAGKTAAKPTPHAFSKFARRRREEF